MKTSTAVSTSILTFIALLQVCPAPPAVLGPILIAANGAVSGSLIAAGIDGKIPAVKRGVEYEQNERLESGCHNWPACE